MPEGHAAAVERVLVERLEGVASDPAAILRRALELAGSSEVPTDPVGLGMFCRGPLDEALARVIGVDAAGAVVEDLARIASALPKPSPAPAPTEDVQRSGSRPKKRKEASGTRRRRAPVVIVVTRDPERGPAVIDALGDRGQACLAGDVFSLMQTAEKNLDRDLALVFDGTVPGLRGPMLMTLARILPPSAEVLFWGAAPPTGSVELRATTLPADATPAEVAEACLGGADEDAPDETLEVILLADDDAVWRSTLERRLRHEGYAVVAVGDGFAALEAAIDHRPALVLTDFDMPTLDGQQLAQLILGRFGADAPPVIMITSHELGPVDAVQRVFPKSVPFEELLAAIESFLSPTTPVPLARPG